MMKIKLITLSLLFLPSLVLAADLPRAGITPESPFYFLDRMGEAIERFFIFSPENRAKLEVVLAKERMAEIEIMIQKNAKMEHFLVAEDNMARHLSAMNNDLSNMKSSGKSTASLAKKISDDFDPSHKALKNSFKEKIKALKVQIDQLKNEFKEARLAGNSVRVNTLSAEIRRLKIQRDMLEQREHELSSEIEIEYEKFYGFFELREEVAEMIREAEDRRLDILRDAQDDKLEISSILIKNFDDVSSRAKSALSSGKFDDARRFAVEGKSSLKEIEIEIGDAKREQERRGELETEIEVEQELSGREFENEIRGGESENELRGRESENELRGRINESETPKQEDRRGDR